MPRKFIKRYTPDPQTIKDHKHLRFLGSWLHNPNLWHMHRRNVARAFAVGVFCAFIPVPFQMLLAAIGAIFFSANMPISVALVWISNPLTMPPMFYGTYKLGAWILGLAPIDFNFELSFKWLGDSLSEIWQPFLLGCFVSGVFFSILAYFTIRIFWRISVSRAWQERKERYRAKKALKLAKNKNTTDKY